MALAVIAATLHPSTANACTTILVGRSLTADGSVIRSLDDLQVGETVTTQVADGTFSSTIDDRD